MVICKFFLEGRCRYGNNCYNEHILDNRYNKYNKGGYSQNKNWETKNSPSYDYEEYDDQYYSGYERNSNSYNRSGYSWHASTYDRDANYDYHPSRYDSNFNKSNKPKPQSYNSGTSFSFTSSKNRFEVLSEPKYTQGITTTPQVDDDFDFSNVKEDMVTWEKGKYWPFSCYSPSKDHQNFSYFNDVSPEELRWKAYEAKENNDFSSYVQSVTEAMKEVDEKRNLLKNSTSTTIQNIKNNSNLFQSTIQPNQSSASFSSGASNFSFKKAITEVSGFNLSRLVENPPKSNFPESVNDKMMTDNSSSFSFQLPAKKIDFSFTAASAKAKVQEEKSPNPLYTLLSELSAEEKDAFIQPVFTLGRIPTRPPPKELCF